MPAPRTHSIHAPLRILLVMVVFVVLFVALSACDKGFNSPDIYDPNEVQNRKIHDFNKSLLSIFVKKDADGKAIKKDKPTRSKGKPNPIIPNFVNNLSMPRRAVNNILQGKLDELFQTTMRFVLNTTVGVAGIVDVATAVGVKNRSADFGQTLHTWGFGEGKFVSLPFFGPSTERDVAGRIVDVFTDPLRLVLSREQRYARLGLRIIGIVQNQRNYWEVSQNLLYESEDSYATIRSFYLQNRRYFLNEGLDINDLEDPYADDYE